MRSLVHSLAAALLALALSPQASANTGPTANTGVSQAGNGDDLPGNATSGPSCADSDYDGACDGWDNCPDVSNANQHNHDDDDDGDACDEDDDNDGFLDDDDACPTAAEDFDGLEDDDGCPESDVDNDGICDPGNVGWCWGSDACPEVSEDFDGVGDSDGCPEADEDGDGFCDPGDTGAQCSGNDACPEQAEDIDFCGDDDGCPEDDGLEQGQMETALYECIKAEAVNAGATWAEAMCEDSRVAVSNFVCSGQQVGTLAGLAAALPALTAIDVSDNMLEDLSPLVGMSALDSVDAAHNRIEFDHMGVSELVGDGVDVEVPFNSISDADDLAVSSEGKTGLTLDLRCNALRRNNQQGSGPNPGDPEGDLENLTTIANNLGGAGSGNTADPDVTVCVGGLCDYPQPGWDVDHYCD